MRGEGMDNTRAILVNEKISEIKQDLEEWVKKLPLLPGETVVAEIDINIICNPILEVKISRKGKKQINLQKEIGAEDWKNILNIPFPEKLKMIVEVFSANGNEPIQSELVWKVLQERGYVPKRRKERRQVDEFDVSRINSYFIKFGFPYRLKHGEGKKPRRGEQHTCKLPMKIRIVE